MAPFLKTFDQFGYVLVKFLFFDLQNGHSIQKIPKLVLHIKVMKNNIRVYLPPYQVAILPGFFNHQMKVWKNEFSFTKAKKASCAHLKAAIKGFQMVPLS